MELLIFLKFYVLIWVVRIKFVKKALRIFFTEYTHLFVRMFLQDMR